MPTYFSAGKINLFLSIGAREASGYHGLTSIMQSIAFLDRIEISFGKEAFSLAVSGGETGPVEDNIITKSWRLLKETYDLPGEIAVKVEKHLPIGAGLAGGTGNGAAIFHAVADEFSLDLKENYALARKIGSDMPFCIIGGTALVEGTGEKVAVLPPLPRQRLLLVNPGFPVSTKEIFAAFDSLSLKEEVNARIFAAKARLGDWGWLKSHLHNDLQRVAFHLYPGLERINDWFLSEGLSPLMSGSGPTIVALISDEEQAERCVATMPKELGRIWSLSTAEKGVYHEREITAGKAGTIPALEASGL